MKLFCADFTFLFVTTQGCARASWPSRIRRRRRGIRKRHNPIWPELEKVLQDHGVSNYSIFLHPETRLLFGYAEIENEEQWAAIASTEICQKWWKHMGDIMPSNPDHSPVSAPLREVFHLD